MIKSYFKIAWRNITARKFYTFLNISGLAIAISCCIVIYLYTSYNLSFDTYHKNSKNIFRLVSEVYLQKTEFDRGSSYRWYTEVKTGIPQVKQAAFSIERQSFIINVNGDVKRRFKEENNVSFANSDWFKMFSYKCLSGSPNQLDDLDNAVLNQKTAHKYFGNTNPIGQILVINNKQIKVTGIIADAPYNTDLKSDIYLSFSSLLPLVPLYDKHVYTDWGYISSTHNTFIELSDANQKEAVEKQIANIEVNKWSKNIIKIYRFKLLPLNAVHFDTRYGGVIQKSLLWNLVIIGLLIIAIAIFNYINLTVAQQTRRATEIATRKVLGGSTRQIFTQFIIESLITSSIAIVLAVILVFSLLPVANNLLFTGDPVYILSYTNLYLFIAVVLVCIAVGTGVYPALLLSRISIAQALKNNLMNLSAGVGRKLMVVFQNTVTQALIICTIIIVLQVHYLRNTDIGFDRKSVVTIPIGVISTSQKAEFGESLKSMPDVQAFSFCNKPPSSDSRRGATFKYNTRTKWETWPARFAIGDASYCSTFGLHLAAGRNMRNEQPTPEFLINEKMAAMLEVGHPDNVLGKILIAGDEKGVIVGIVKDFNVKSLVEPIEPSIILEDKNLQTNLAVKLSGNQTASILNKLQTAYQRILPDQLFSYQFIDEQIAQLYKKETIQQKLIWLSAIVAIVISSLGLLGLVSLIALQRTKEIGIRKVLGATATQISLMLSNDFLWMVLIAFVIAAPLSFWAMNKWLQSFAYRINIDWWIFALAGLIAIIIAVITICFQSIKAAIANPVDSLRSE
jgi:putative ABC transport system permease protein